MRTPTSAAVLLLLAGVVLAQDLPLDLPLDEQVPLNGADQVVVELRRADVHVLIVPLEGGERPLLRTEAAADGYTVDVELAPPLMTLRQAAGQPPDGRRLRVELRLTPAQQLVLRGTGLDVVLEAAPDAFEPPPNPVEGARYRLDVEDSQVNVTGLPDAVVHASAGSTAALNGGRGTWTLELRESSADVRGHTGELALTSVDGEATFHDGDAAVQLTMQGGRLAFEGGAGRLAGTAEDASLAFNTWHGDVELRGGGNTLDAYSSHAQLDAWKLSGRGWQVVLGDFQGIVDLETAGGRLEGRNVQGVRFEGRENASADVSGVENNAELKLTDGAEARLVEVFGTVNVHAEDAVVDLEGIGQLRLEAVRSQVSILDVRGMQQVRVEDSELTLDLVGAPSDRSISLQGESRADVTLPEPCVVRLLAPAENVDVVGCELVVPGQSVRARPGGKRPYVLAVTLSEGSVLEAEGR